MKKSVAIYLLIICMCSFLFTKPIQSEIIYMKDGQVIDGAVIFEDKRIMKVETDIKTWTIEKKHIKRIMYGKRKMEKIFILMNTGDIIKGYLIDQDNEKIIIRLNKNDSKEKSISKSLIKQMSPKEIKLFDPEFMFMGGIYFPLNSGGAELNPGWLVIGALEFNLIFIKHMRMQIETGYSSCTSKSNDGLQLDIVPLKFNLQYVFHMDNFHLLPRLGSGGIFMSFNDGEGAKTSGIRPMVHGGIGAAYTLVDKSLYARANIDYAMIFDSGSNLSGLFITLGFGIRF